MIIPLLLSLRKAICAVYRRQVHQSASQDILQRLIDAELFVRTGVHSTLEDTQQLLQTVGETVLWDEGWLCDVVVLYLSCVKRHEGL